MTNYEADYDDSIDTERDYEPAEWLVGTVRRNPEAFLVLAAGCALLLRGSGSSRSRSGTKQTGYRGATARGYSEGVRYDERSRDASGRLRAARDGLSDAAETAGDYATEVRDRIYDTASSYASTVSHYADDQRRQLSRQASRLGNKASRLGSKASRLGYRAQSATGQMLHEQPLAVAALGLAAGAAVAALLPRLDVERRTFGPARDALADAASRAAGSVREAAGEAGRRLQEGAAERGLSPDGLKDLAREAAESFTDSMSDDFSKTGGGTSTVGASSGGTSTPGRSAPGGGTSGGTPSGTSTTGTSTTGTSSGGTSTAGRSGSGGSSGGTGA